MGISGVKEKEYQKYGIVNVIWFDENYDSKENIEYSKELEVYKNLKIKCFKTVEEGIEYIKKIEFEETSIILSSRLYSDFITNFKNNLEEFKVIPKIIIFTRHRAEFLKYNKEYENYIDNSFYKFGGIKVAFSEVKDFILGLTIKKFTETQNEGNLIFEYIDCKEKLYYPILYQSLIDSTRTDKIDIYTESLFNKYKEKNDKIRNLLEPIRNILNIPIELLSKYYARLYTAEENFYKDINRDLKDNKKDEYLSYIKILYEGVKTKSLPLASNNILYRGGSLLNKEIETIKQYLNNKKEGLPGSIVFSKTFLSFSKEKRVARNFLSFHENTQEKNKVLFILEKNEEINYDLSTHADIENLSFYPSEKEVLFFPFSSFEIKDVKEININNDKVYEIKLLYLGKYLKDLENYDNEIPIPESKFKNQFLDFGLTEKVKIKNTPNFLLQQYYIFKEKIENKGLNCILSEVYLKEKDLNKNIRIINSYEENQRENNITKFEDKKMNEKEIKDNIEIRIDDKLIPFSYFYKFLERGKHKIKYIFKNIAENINNIFHRCEYLTKVNLSYFDSRYIKDMSFMFKDCKHLENINFSNFVTKNSIDMNNMFYGCESLKKIDLSTFDTQMVTNMDSMFYGCEALNDINLTYFNTFNVKNMRSMFSRCKSLTNIDLSNFNTENVTDMSYMFFRCNSLISLNLSNFIGQKINNLNCIFYECESLINIDLSNFIIPEFTEVEGMFIRCKSLKKENIKTKDNTILNEFLSHH